MTGILVTGGSGTFGTAIVKRLLQLNDYDRIVVFSRGELRQHHMRSEVGEDDRLRYYIGDTRDRDRLKRAMNKIQVVVHAAALKRIEVGHHDPVEMTKTNVGGAINIIEAAQDAGVEKVIALSSDKAVEPISPYGLSKALADGIFLAANNITGGETKFSVARWGNIWRSNGSVVPIWEKMIRDGATSVPVTDAGCTRFFLRIEQVVELVLNLAKTMKGGELLIPDMAAYRLGDLAQAMNVKMDIKGLPPWEKKHESIKIGSTSEWARRMTIDELKKELANV